MKSRQVWLFGKSWDYLIIWAFVWMKKWTQRTFLVNDFFYLYELSAYLTDEILIRH